MPPEALQKPAGGGEPANFIRICRSARRAMHRQYPV
jgi:hypothetical protein